MVFIISKVVEFSGSDEDSYFWDNEYVGDLNGIVPGTEVRVYFKVRSDDVYWVRDRDRAMIFDSRDDAYVDWVDETQVTFEELTEGEAEAIELKQSRLKASPILRAYIASLEARLAEIEGRS